MAAPWNAPWNAPRVHSEAELDVLRRSIVCFYADEKFTDMAVVAVTTLLQRTPGVDVGVLAPSLLLSQMYIFAPGIAIAKKTHWQLWVTLLSAAASVAIASVSFGPISWEVRAVAISAASGRSSITPI